MRQLEFDQHLQVLQGRRFTSCPTEDGDDIPFVAAHLREGDRLEIERFYKESPEEVLRRSFQESVMCWTAFAPDKTPVAVWGVAKNPLDASTGIPWMMGTDLIRESYGDFLWLSRHYDRIMGRYFHWLVNLVDAEYAGAIRWLTWMRYQKGDTVKSPKGYDFITMYKDTRDVR